MARTILQGLFARLQGLLLAAAATGFVVPGQAEAQQDADAAAWQAAQQAGTFDAYQEYLGSHPTGRFASGAFARMMEMAIGEVDEGADSPDIGAALY
ncbi:MAG: hypothetical protein ACREDZ_10170 [Kiloniellales bacterium]